MRFILKKVPSEHSYYDFTDQVELDYSKVCICGNRDFSEFGDQDYIDIIEGNYYDDETGYEYDKFEQLKKVTGKTWKVRTMKGYSQSEWTDLYYVEGEVSEEYLKEIEDFYMGKVDEFRVIEDEDEDTIYHVFIPHDIVWKGKESICRYLDLPPEYTVVYEDDGYEKVYKYKEIK